MTSNVGSKEILQQAGSREPISVDEVGGSNADLPLMNVSTYAECDAEPNSQVAMSSSDGHERLGSTVSVEIFEPSRFAARAHSALAFSV
eukprot:Skav226732  [mRNA]  locus=scaffold720:140156:140522:- [translate_table: standard]